MEIIRDIEFEISPETHRQIEELYQVCFLEAQPRSYFKQLPHFRYLAFTEDNLVAHMGVDHRVIRVGDAIFTIFGIIDLCVEPEYRRKGIASQLLNMVTELASQNSIDFLFLVSHQDSIYLNNGFQAVSQECTWLGIDEHRNCGVITETIAENFLIKQTGDRALGRSTYRFTGIYVLDLVKANSHSSLLCLIDPKEKDHQRHYSHLQSKIRKITSQILTRS